MKFFLCGLATIALLLSGEETVSAGFISLDPTGSLQTHATGVSGINVVGYYYTSGSIAHGFLYNGSAYTTLDVPGSIQSFANAVSGNNVVGTYLDTGGKQHSFLYNGAGFTTLDPTESNSTVALGVSGNNVVGNYLGADSRIHGFLYNGSGFATLDPAGSKGTNATGVSGNNVAGYYQDAGGITHGFVYNGSGYATLDAAGSTESQVSGISGNNVVGTYVDSGGRPRSFLFNGSSFSTLDPAGSTETQVKAISGNNVAGYWTDASGKAHGFLYNGSAYTILDVPEATGTYAQAISGDNVTGYYLDSSGGIHGFLYQSEATAVPEPSSFGLVGICIVGIVGYARRHRLRPGGMLSGFTRGIEIQTAPTPKACEPATARLPSVPCFRGGGCKYAVAARVPRMYATRPLKEVFRMPCSRTLALSVFLSLWFTAKANADIVILDFESFRMDDAIIHDHAGILEFQGFTITSVPPLGNAFRFNSAGTLHPLFAGSTALWNGQGQAENILTAANGGPFSLFSINLAAIAPGASDPAGLTDPGPFDLTFTAKINGGAAVSNTFTINNKFLVLETYTFTGFENVLSVSWFQGSGFNPPGPPLPGEASHQFDNIVIASVPEPTSFLLVSIGLPVMFFAARKGNVERHV